MKELKEPIAAYIAGVLDSDGCITISKLTDPTMRAGVCYRPYVSVSNTKMQLLEFLQKSTGLGKIHPHKTGNPKAKPAWQWSLWSKQAAAVLTAVLPYLTIKKKQAELVLFLQSRAFITGRSGMSNDELELRQGLHTQIQVLNKRGR